MTFARRSWDRGVASSAIAATVVGLGCDRSEVEQRPAETTSAVVSVAASAPESTPSSASGAPELATQGMVRIPEGDVESCLWVHSGGKLVGGCASGARARTQHFELDRTETTVAQYEQCVNDGACTTNDLSTASACNWPRRASRPGHPANCLGFQQAKAFCAWAGKRLPTRLEWERAARGPDGRAFPWGGVDDVPSSGAVGGSDSHPQELRRVLGLGYCWHRVGTCTVDAAGAANGFGVVGMAGNVAEWVEGSAADDERIRRHIAPTAEHEKWHVLYGTAWSDPELDDVNLLGLARAHAHPPTKPVPISAGVRCAK